MLCWQSFGYGNLSLVLTPQLADLLVLEKKGRSLRWCSLAVTRHIQDKNLDKLLRVGSLYARHRGGLSRRKLLQDFAESLHPVAWLGLHMLLAWHSDYRLETWCVYSHSFRLRSSAAIYLPCYYKGSCTENFYAILQHSTDFQVVPYTLKCSSPRTGNRCKIHRHIVAE